MKKPELVYVTYIRTTPQKLWDAITKPEFARQYWGNTNVSDWKEGSDWNHLSNDGKNEVWVTGKVVESKPPQRLVLTWADPDDLKDASKVTFDLEHVDKLVRLTVTHNDFKAKSTMPGKVNKGWPLVLSSLKSFLETGKGIDIHALKNSSQQS